MKRILMQYPGIHNFKVIELDIDTEYHESSMEYLEKLCHVNSTPYIFMNSNYVSVQEFQTMHDKGTLKHTFQEMGVLSKSIDEGIPQHATALLSVGTHRSYDEVCASMSQIVPRFKYSILHNYNFTHMLQARGQPCTRPISVYDVCQPVHAAHVLSSNPWMACALPCRISLWCDDHNHVIIQSIRPSTLMSMMGGDESYNKDALNNESHQVEDELYTIMLQLATDPHHECGQTH